MTTTHTPRGVPEHVPSELVFDFDFYDMAGETDVYQRYRKVQETLPDIFYTPRNGGHWVVTRYDVLVSVLDNPMVFSSRIPVIPAPPESGGFGLVNLDGDRHAALRKLIQPTLVQPLNRPSKQGQKLDAYITDVAVGLIESVRPRGECEFYADFASKLPITVVMKTIVDLPMEDAPQLQELVGDVARAGSNPAEFHAAFAGLARYFQQEIIPLRRAHPGHDTISAIVHGRIDGEPLSDDEIMAVCNTVIVGGLDTVTSALLYSAWYLAEHPAERARLREDPSLVTGAVEELLRRFAIINTARCVATDVEFHGVRFVEGDLVFVPSTAAAVDERRYPDAMAVDFGRADKRHLTFYRGPHVCPGAQIARRQLRIFVREWLSRIPEYQLKPGVQVRMMAGLGNRIVDLPLVWDVPTQY
ncbi:MAG TPA: cytochrome P450 [Pseudonocardiaceae bacterium]|nr:cytochrome P450 [Pseudonocardiaceae bacterium]